MNLRELNEITREKNKIDNRKMTEVDYKNGIDKFFEQKRKDFEKLIANAVITINEKDFNETLENLRETKLSPKRVMNEEILTTIYNLHNLVK